MSGELSEELTVATRLAREAGATIMRVYATDFSVAYKGKGDPVTQADQLAKRVATFNSTETARNQSSVTACIPKMGSHRTDRPSNRRDYQASSIQDLVSRTLKGPCASDVWGII